MIPMCTMKYERVARLKSLPQDQKNIVLSLPDDDHTLVTLAPASDSSSGSDTRSTLWKNLAVTKARTTAPPAVVNVAPTRAMSNVVTHARTTAPKPPLPVMDARAMNCSHYSCRTEDERITSRDALVRKPSSLRRGSSKDTEKHVSFGDLEMRYYAVVLGDHPDCSSGPPVRSTSMSCK
jgi:hypothetical protein